MQYAICNMQQYVSTQSFLEKNEQSELQVELQIHELKQKPQHVVCFRKS